LTFHKPFTYSRDILPLQTLDLTEHYLIAMPAMADPRFAKTLTYVCEHNAQGALGVIVNKPIDMNLQSLLKQIHIDFASDRCKSLPVHYGGPVQADRGFILHKPSGQWQSSLKVGEEVGLTTSKDILEAVAKDEGPENLLVCLGHAGWGPGQLEQEMAQNAWLSVRADPHLLFSLPANERYEAAFRLLGINFAMLSDEAGHA
jgi:putative transcriptional regulator